MTVQHTALITGANRGLGLETARQLTASGLRVVLTARDDGAAAQAAEQLPGALAETLDVADPAAALACAQRLDRRGVQVDIVVNNAGVYSHPDLDRLDAVELERVMEVNFFGPFHAIKAFAPAMIQRGWGRIVNVSSGYGLFSEGLGGPLAYSVSKAALNALTLTAARSLPDSVKVLAVSPGWVRTRMGGPTATTSLKDGAARIVQAALWPDDGPSGVFLRHGKPAAW